jgi:hypothetical protein
MSADETIDRAELVAAATALERAGVSWKPAEVRAGLERASKVRRSPALRRAV